MSVEVDETGDARSPRTEPRDHAAPRRPLGTGRARVIEVTGAPGAGKTTLLPALAAGCTAAGMRPYTIVDAARPFAARTVIGRLVARLPGRVGRAGLWAVFRTMSAAHTVLFIARHPRLTGTVLATQRGRPPRASAAERRVVYWYLRLMGSYSFLRARARAAEVLILDEGFVHRTVQLFSSSVETPSAHAIDRYVAHIPRPDLVVHVEATPASCRARIRARGRRDHLADRSGDHLDRFVANAHQTVGLTVGAVRRRHWPVAAVPNDGGDRCAAPATARDLVAARLSGHSAPPAGRPTATVRRPWYVPRPSRVAARVRARTRSDQHDHDWYRDLLAPYGLPLVAGPEAVPFGARNAHVILQTPDGAKVLRRYRSWWPADSVRHEHAVLQRLAELDFPAVRVVATRGGSTFVRRDGHVFALFDRSHGVNYSSTFVSGRGRASLLREAGRTLAMMHDLLVGYAPAVDHHVTVQAGLAGDASGAQWHLAALESLASTIGHRGTADPVERELAERAGYARQRLVELDATLRTADLSQVVIHGDYGLHNLLFADDASAIVCDFELARLDRRLVDLVIVLSRIGDRGGRSFLRGYRSAASLRPDEVQLMPMVWEFHHLTGAVRSWHNHRTHAGNGRLTTARRRLIEAQRVHHEGLTSWM